MMKFSKPEQAAINAAYEAIQYLCSITSWEHSPAFITAYKAMRKDSDCQTEARGRIVKAWRAGTRAADMDVSITNYPFGYTAAYRAAFDLGCVLAMRHSGPNRSDYTGPRYDKAHCLAPAAVQALEDCQNRWLSAESAGFTVCNVI